jgi:cation transport ATPase
VNQNKFIARWAISWACLAAALGLHVADEALTGFLPMYNSVIESLRETYRWVPFPTFTFPVWLGGLITLFVLLFALTPLVLRGYRWLRGLSYFLGVLMIANALGHISLSIWLGEFAPGVYSSPVLLIAAIALLVTAKQSSMSRQNAVL